MLYKVKLSGTSGYVYVLFEHKSYHEKYNLKVTPHSSIVRGKNEKNGLDILGTRDLIINPKFQLSFMGIK